MIFSFPLQLSEIHRELLAGPSQSQLARATGAISAVLRGRNIEHQVAILRGLQATSPLLADGSLVSLADSDEAGTVMLNHVAFIVRDFAVDFGQRRFLTGAKVPTSTAKSDYLAQWVGVRLIAPTNVREARITQSWAGLAREDKAKTPVLV